MCARERVKKKLEGHSNWVVGDEASVKNENGTRNRSEGGQGTGQPRSRSRGKRGCERLPRVRSHLWFSRSLLPASKVCSEATEEGGPSEDSRRKTELVRLDRNLSNN